MKYRLARGLLILLISGRCAGGLAAPQGEPPAASEVSRAPAEKESCQANLRLIYQAVEAYKAERGDLPQWLSDLVPGYLPDTNTLVCPVSRRTGRTERPPLSDPKIASSYLFEFCPVPLRGRGTNGTTHTRREWKRRQMDLAGPMVPIVRCRFHEPVLNLAFDGHIYESPRSWEALLTNRMDPAELTFARIFGWDTPKVSGKRGGKGGPSLNREAWPTNAAAKGEPQEAVAASTDAGAISNFALQSGHVEAPALPAAGPVSNRPEQAADWTPVLLWCAWMAVVTITVVLFILRARSQRRIRSRRQPALLPAKVESSVVTPSCTVVIAPQSLTGSALEAPTAASPPGSRLRLKPRERWVKPAIAPSPSLPALPAPVPVERERSLEQAGLLAYVSLWLKQKLVRKLIADRAELIRTQQSAALQMKHVDERLAKIERQIQVQNRTYEQRIEELTRELLVAKEENRALIQARIDQVRAEMEAARARALAQAEQEL